MSVVKERIYVAAPYTQARASSSAGSASRPPQSGTWLLLAFPAGEGRDITRSVTARGGARKPRLQLALPHRLGRGTTAGGAADPRLQRHAELSAGEDYGETALELDGRYDPPGGAAGRAFDELVGRRVAHATMHALLTASASCCARPTSASKRPSTTANAR